LQAVDEEKSHFPFLDTLTELSQEEDQEITKCARGLRKEDEMDNKIDTLVEELSKYFFDDDFANSFEKFAEEHVSLFQDDQEENKHEYMDVYKKFLALFEMKLEDFVKSQNMTNDDFYAVCRKISEQPEEADPAYSLLQVLLATSDFDVFMSLMREVSSKARKQDQPAS